MSNNNPYNIFIDPTIDMDGNIRSGIYPISKIISEKEQKNNNIKTSTPNNDGIEKLWDSITTDETTYYLQPNAGAKTISINLPNFQTDYLEDDDNIKVAIIDSLNQVSTKITSINSALNSPTKNTKLILNNNDYPIGFADEQKLNAGDMIFSGIYFAQQATQSSADATQSQNTIGFDPIPENASDLRLFYIENQGDKYLATQLLITFEYLIQIVFPTEVLLWSSDSENSNGPNRGLSGLGADKRKALYNIVGTFNYYYRYAKNIKNFYWAYIKYGDNDDAQNETTLLIDSLLAQYTTFENEKQTIIKNSKNPQSLKVKIQSIDKKIKEEVYKPLLDALSSIYTLENGSIDGSAIAIRKALPYSLYGKGKGKAGITAIEHVNSAINDPSGGVANVSHRDKWIGDPTNPNSGFRYQLKKDLNEQLTSLVYNTVRYGVRPINYLKGYTKPNDNNFNIQKATCPDKKDCFNYLLPEMKDFFLQSKFYIKSIVNTGNNIQGKGYGTTINFSPPNIEESDESALLIDDKTNELLRINSFYEPLKIYLENENISGTTLDEILIFLRGIEKNGIENIYLTNFDKNDLVNICNAGITKPSFGYLSNSKIYTNPEFNNKLTRVTEKIMKIIPSRKVDSDDNKLSYFNQYNIWYHYKNSKGENFYPKQVK